MKKVLSVLLSVVAICGLSACYYRPPEGWNQKHHTYEDVLAFAQSIDPNATVAQEYHDTVHEYGWEYREWDAVINGISCHVASLSDWVWNDGFAAGEFQKFYYRIDTDYEYVVMQTILSEKYPNWKMNEGMRSKYHSESIYADLTLPEYKMLNDDELGRVWKEMRDINGQYEKFAIGRKAELAVPAPTEAGIGPNSNGEIEYFVIRNSRIYISDFSEEGKMIFLQKYQDAWALLESGLPIRD